MALWIDLSSLADGSAPRTPETTVLSRTDGRHLFYPDAVNAIGGSPSAVRSLFAVTAVDSLPTGPVAVVLLGDTTPREVVRTLLTLGARLDVLSNPDVFRVYDVAFSDALPDVVHELTAFGTAPVILVDGIEEFYTAGSEIRRPLSVLARSGAAVVATYTPEAVYWRSLSGAVVEAGAFKGGSPSVSTISVMRDSKGWLTSQSSSDWPPRAANLQVWPGAGNSMNWALRPPTP
jgi:hypothetical protein